MGDYQYPGWGEALGFLISLSSMIWVPGYMVYYFFATPGTWREVLKKGTTPIIVPRAEAAKSRELQEIKDNEDDVERQLLEKAEPCGSSSSGIDKTGEEKDESIGEKMSLTAEDKTQDSV